jgi:hypothetical protein
MKSSPPAQAADPGQFANFGKQSHSREYCEARL